MREARLTDRQKHEKDPYGSYAPRVRGREVTAQSKDGSQTRRGGAAMNSTATELEFTRRRAMRGIMKGFVIGVLGLAGLLVPVGYVHALDNTESCAKAGWVLCENGKCGTTHCVCNGKALAPGETCTKMIEEKHIFYYCDGCSGKMLDVRTPQPNLQLRTPQPNLQLTPAVPPSRVKPPAGGTLQKSP